MRVDARDRRRGSSRLRRIALASVVLGLCVEALYPFSFDPPRWRENEVTRTAEGLRFGGYNVARTPGPPGFLSEVRDGSGLRIDLEIRAARADQSGPARILSLSRDYWNSALLVAQSGADLIVVVKGARGPGLLRVEDVFSAEDWHRVEVRLDASEIAVAVDGRTRATAKLGDGYARAWSDDDRLALGDEPRNNRPWRGEMRVASITVDGRALDCLRGGEVEIPARAWYLPERLWALPRHLFRDDPVVAGLHLLSYVPLGALAGLGAARRRELRAALGIALGLSIALQLAKIAFAGRHPSLVDVVAAGVGAGLGAWAVAGVRSRRGGVR